MSLWTVQQHEWLEALGHPVLLLAGDPALGVAAPVASPAKVVTGPAPERAHPAGRASAAARSVKPTVGDTQVSRVALPARTGADDGTGVRQAPDTIRPRADVATKKAALEEARRASRSARPVAPDARHEDVLLAAVLRATGMEAPAARQVMTALEIDLDRLRAEPSAKRALWVQLRRQRGDRNR